MTRLLARKQSPYLPFESLQSEMNRLFNAALGRWTGEEEMRSGGWNPAVDIQEDKDKIRVVAEIPGINKEDLNVSVQGHQLVIQGEKKQERESKGDGYTASERVFGSFYRALELPEGVDEGRVDAVYKNGLLELTMPKKEDAKPKQINVQVK